MKPTDAAYTTIQESDLLARNPDGELTEVRKALDIADACMCKAINDPSDERQVSLLPAAAITTLVQLIDVLERRSARKGRLIVGILIGFAVSTVSTLAGALSL